MMVVAVIAVGEGRAQGDISEKPRPMPSTSRISDSAAEAVAPAKMAGHDTAPCPGPAGRILPNVVVVSSSRTVTVAMHASRVDQQRACAAVLVRDSRCRAQ